MKGGIGMPEEIKLIRLYMIDREHQASFGDENKVIRCSLIKIK
jgi:hypothetical protein